jgi:hypothetical protein
LFVVCILKEEFFFTKKYAAFFLILVFVIIMQGLTTDIFDTRSISGILIRFLFPFVSILLLREKFINKYINIVYYLSVIGLIFFILKNVFPDFNSFLITLGQELPFDDESGEFFLIYSSRYKEFGTIMSNSGFASEPGAYAILLSIALIFSIFKTGKLITKEGFVFVSALLSTFSTAGYISLALILGGYLYKRIQKNKYLLILLYGLLVLIFAIVYKDFDFMGEKIHRQIELSMDPYQTKGRFASAAADIEVWKTNPLWGTGKSALSYSSTVASLGFESEHRVNGLANFLAKFGIIIFLLYFIYLYQSISEFAKKAKQPIRAAQFYWLSLVSVAFAQICLQWPLYIILLYIPLALRHMIFSTTEIALQRN